MKQVSPIAFRSNLYPLKQDDAHIRSDKDFLAQIRDRKAIAVLHEEIEHRAITEWMYKPSEIQEKIYGKIVVPPAWCLLYPETQPWGAVLVDGKERVVCKCDRSDCKGYQYCQKSIINAAPSLAPDGQREQMEKWYQGWTDLKYRIEEIRTRYNANELPNDNIIEQIEKFVSEAEKKDSVDLWLQKLCDLNEKGNYEAYNAELSGRDKRLDDISKLKSRLEVKASEIKKCKRIAENSREFHQNWVTDWKALEDEADKLLKNLPVERFVSDFADKVEELSQLIESVKSSEKRHKESIEKYQTVEGECSGLLTRIQELFVCLDEIADKVKKLTPVADNFAQDQKGEGDISNQRLFESYKQVEQEEFIHFPVDARTIVNAGPGRGKTYSLIERIIYLVKEENVAPEDILVLCFSRAAVAEVQNRIQKKCAGDEELEGLDWQIGTIDSYCWMLTHSDDEQAVENMIPNSYDAGIRNALKRLNAGKQEVPDYKYIIVDEIQDIISIRAQFVLELLQHLEKGTGFALLGDFCQSIYDFQLKDKENDVVTSSRFFKALCNISGVDRISFFHNYRSDADSALNKKLDAMRPALINEDADSAAQQIKDIENSGILSSDTLDSIVDSVIEESKEESHKATGILTWKNVTVTEIASRFYECMFENDVYYPVHVQRRKDNAYLAGWIGLFFQHYQGDRIDKEKFIDSFESFFDDETKQKLNMNLPAFCYWDALEQCMVEEDSYGKGHYTVESLLRNIRLKAWRFRENCGILLSGFVPNSSIIISNVHQAKGREYDQVYISKDLLDVSCDPSDETCRVAYVALSRTKGDVGILDEEFDSFPRWHCIDRMGRGYKKNGERRGFRPSKIEFGLYGDIDEAGFAKKEIQQYIQKFLPVGTLLQLNKHITYQDGQRELGYELAMDGGDFDIPDVLGKAGCAFMEDLYDAMSDATRRRDMLPSLEDYPRIINNLYVNDLITIIDKDLGQGDGVKKYGNLAVWSGLSLTGIGKCEYSY